MTVSDYRRLCSVARALGWRVLLCTNTCVDPEERLDGEAHIILLSVFAERWNGVARVTQPGNGDCLDGAARQLLGEAHAAGLLSSEDMT